MSYREPFATGEWYHCFNRGVDKRKVFQNKKDFERFLMLLYVSNSEQTIHLSNFSKDNLLFDSIFELEQKTIVDVGAYCLMGNHFHLLIRAKNPKDISLYMQKISTAYSMYFNKRYERTGTLFQGKFKSRRIDTDLYFKRVFNYIHANPAELYEPKWKQGIIKNKEGVKKALMKYSYSSLPDFLSDERPSGKILAKQQIIDLFNGVPSIENLLEEAIIFAVDKNNL